MNGLLLSDPGETKNIANSNPEKLAELLRYWQEYEAETGTVMKPANVQATEGYGGHWRYSRSQLG